MKTKKFSFFINFHQFLPLALFYCSDHEDENKPGEYLPSDNGDNGGDNIVDNGDDGDDGDDDDDGGDNQCW